MKKQHTKLFIYIFLSVFTFSFLLYIVTLKTYTTDSKQSYTNAVRNEIENLISQKEIDTYMIAKNLANNTQLIEIMRSKQFEKLYTTNFIEIPEEYLKYHNIRFHIVDKDGYQRYLSWTKKDLGNYILNHRKDLQKVYHNPKPFHNISVGKFSIAFKGIVPIFDKEHNFLGIIETITYFNSIVKALHTHQIHSAVLIDKSLQKKLQYPLSKIFIQGYNVANLFIDDEVLYLLRHHNVDELVQTTTYRYIGNEKSIFERGYYFISIPLYNFQHQKIGYYTAFITDKNFLAQKEYLLNFLLFLLSLLFVFMVLLALKEYKENLKLIQNLDQEVKKQLAEKMQLLYIDSTTGAYKKNKFDVDVASNLDTKTVILNIKNFSKLNAYYGFDTGDAILAIVVQRVERILDRKIYRLNGDEFLFFSKQPKEEIIRIKEDFAQHPVKISKKNLSIRLSFYFGVAPTRLQKLVSKLSIAVHEAKQHPFSHFMYYREKSLDTNFIKFNTLLSQAIFKTGNTTLLPFFQGIYNNKLKSIKKYEALVRMEKDGQLFTPYHFLDVAQNSGFIHEITKIMIEKSCAYLATLPEDIEISLNITEYDLATKKLRDLLLQTTQKYNIQPQRITLEILEGISLTRKNNSFKQLRQLKELGFKIAIDDFGVEYSNFERLSEIDVDFIKIDGKYIKSILTNQKSLQITKAIVDFAHALEIQLVAEFVENKEIQELVEQLGIEFSQGYYFSKPSKEIEV